MAFNAKPDLDFNKYKRERKGIGDLGKIVDMVRGITGDVKAGQAEEAQAAKARSMDDIFRKYNESQNQKPIQPQQGQLNSQPQQGQQPSMSQQAPQGFQNRPNQLERDMNKQFPQQAYKMQQDRKAQEIKERKENAEIAQNLITNKKSLYEYQIKQHEMIGDILSNVDGPKTYNVATRMIKEIDPDMQLPKSFPEAKSFLNTYPNMKETIIKRNKQLIENDKAKHDMSLADKKFEFEKKKYEEGKDKGKDKDSKYSETQKKDISKIGEGVSSYNELMDVFERNDLSADNFTEIITKNIALGASKIPLVGGKIAPKTNEMFQMKKRLAESILRAATGAAAPDKEVSTYMNFMPSPGDSKEEAANKAKAARAQLKSIAAGLIEQRRLEIGNIAADKLKSNLDYTISQMRIPKEEDNNQRKKYESYLQSKEYQEVENKKPSNNLIWTDQQEQSLMNDKQRLRELENNN